jgi:DeoR family transcriptional regulator of aga operon
MAKRRATEHAESARAREAASERPVRNEAPADHGDGQAPEERGGISAARRRGQMLALIKQREFVPVTELSQRFGISGVTVRSDLDFLAQRGQVHRIRGGAVPRFALGHERPFEETAEQFAEEKLAIGQAAAALVDHGETVLLDVGTTTVAAAHALLARAELRDVVVFTNGLKTALELEPAIPRLTVVVIGGTLRPLQHSLVDPLAAAILEQLAVKTLFLGCNGVDPVGGITNINLPEAEIKRRMLRIAARRVVLADGSKLGRIELAHLCPVAEIDMLITGASADPDVVGSLRERGCEVVIAA